MAVVVATFQYRHEAELARGFLEDAGIDSSLLVDDAGGAQLGMAFSNPARIVVREADAEPARVVLRAAGILPEAD